MRLPPTGPTGHYSVAVAELAEQDASELDVHLEAMPEVPGDIGRLAGPLHADIHLQLRGPHLLLKAKAKGDLSLVCHRCLGEFSHPVDLKIDEHMVVQEEESREEIEWELATVTESIPPSGEVELVDWLRQHLILSLPAKQICNAACALPETGKVAEAQGDPRWDALRQLRQRAQGDDNGTA